MELYIIGFLVLVSSIRPNLCNEVSGYIFPFANNTLRKRVGSTIEIMCTIQNTRPGYDSRNLTFEIDLIDSNVQIDEIEKEEEIVNNLTKLFRIKNAPAMRANLDCSLGKDGLDQLAVQIGTIPEKIDLKCYSYDWDGINCSFEQPTNRVSVQYKMFYKMDTQPNFVIGPNECNLTRDNGKVFCNISGIASSWRPVYDYLFVRLEAANELGIFNQNLTFNTPNIVVPGPPVDVTDYNKTSDSIVLEWYTSDRLITYSKSFMYTINFTCKRFNGTWITIGPFTEVEKKDNGRRRMQHVLKNLPYAHTWYDVRIALKAINAPDVPEMWSNYTSFLFQTAGRKPENSPKTNIGAFSISVNTGQIRIYWKALPEHEYNGDRFGYFVKNRTGIVWSNENDTRSIDARSTSAKILNIDGNALNKSITFTIYSNNSIGHSLNSTTIRIPAKSERLEPPFDIKKIRKQNSYKILWTAPRNNSQITSYTVFWCEPNKELPNECSGPIDFKELGRNDFMFNFTTTTMYNFAISANSYVSSSGMVWAMCTHGGGEINKMSGILVSELGARFIEYTWNLDCIDRTILTKYEMEICTVKDPKNNMCDTNSTKTFNISGNTTSYRVNNLTPYTIYRTRIRMISDDTVGPWSEPIEKNTIESAPTPPLDLRIKNILDTSALLEWKKPLELNGVLNKYVVRYSNVTVNVELTGASNTPSETMKYELTGLNGFTNYTVVVEAHTVARSEPSNQITFQTHIGHPSKIETLSVAGTNYSWRQPDKPAGRVQYYELLVTKEGKSESWDKIIKIPSTTCTLRRNICDFYGLGLYTFQVRGVNVDHSPFADIETRNKYMYDYGHVIVSRDLGWAQSQPDEICQEAQDEAFLQYLSSDKHPVILPGHEWSNLAPVQCSANSSDGGHIYVLIFLLVFGSVFAYASFYVYDKLRGMGKISIKVPDGLEDANDAKPKPISDDSSSITVILSSNEQTRRLLDPLKKASLSSEENEDGDNSTEEDSAQTLSETIEIDKMSPTSILPVQINAAGYITDFSPKLTTTSSTFGKPSPMPSACNNSSLVTATPNVPPSGYVTLDSVMSKPSNGYTPWNVIEARKQIDKQQPPNKGGIKIKSPLMPSTDIPGISGYVTHKQLSDFGQSLH